MPGTLSINVWRFIGLGFWLMICLTGMSWAALLINLDSWTLGLIWLHFVWLNLWVELDFRFGFNDFKYHIRIDLLVFPWRLVIGEIDERPIDLFSDIFLLFKLKDVSIELYGRLESQLVSPWKTCAVYLLLELFVCVVDAKLFKWVLSKRWDKFIA